VQALRLQPERKTISFVEAPAWVTPWAQEGARAAEDGTLEPWINRRRGGNCAGIQNQHTLKTDIRCHVSVIT
jgi:hypothetical protein